MLKHKWVVVGLIALGMGCFSTRVWADSIGIKFSHASGTYTIGKNVPGQYKDSWQSGSTNGIGTFKVTNLSTANVQIRLRCSDATPKTSGGATDGTKLTWYISTSVGPTQYRLWWAQTGAGSGNAPNAKPTNWNSIQRYDQALTTLSGYINNETTGVMGTTSTVSAVTASNSISFDLQMQMAQDYTFPPADHYDITLYLSVDELQAAVAGKWFYSPSANAYFTNIGSANMAYSNSGSSGTLTWNRNASEATIDSTGFTNLYNDGIIQYLDYTWSPSYTYHSTWDGYPDYTHRLNYYNYLGTYNYSYTHYNGLSSPQWVKSLVGPQ